MRLINADRMRRTIATAKWHDKMDENVAHLIADNEPTIYVIPPSSIVGHAHWEYDETGVAFCSACGCEDALSRYDYDCRGGKIRNNDSKFCPSCGSIMDGKNGESDEH